MNAYEVKALRDGNGEEILMYLSLRDKLPKCRSKADFKKILAAEYPDSPDSDELQEIQEQADAIWPRRLEWEVEILRTLLKHAKEYADNPELPPQEARKELETEREICEIDKRATQEKKQARNRAEQRARFNSMSTNQLHQFVKDFHWDMVEDDRDDLRAVLHAPNCAKGTALFMFWQLEGFHHWFNNDGFIRHYPRGFPDMRDATGEERRRQDDSFVAEVFGRIIGNAFKTNSISFDLVSYLKNTAHPKVKDEYGVIPPEMRRHFPRCLTNSKYDASITW